ncbi:prepilin-type N-terminal cleavage/methylation domain-containing protein [Herbaspirillum sp. CF444]|uniref:type II secretion system protein n=1 Tax=Herbaspirillum sp. CF444 TaxID=1144319 RepID=UPI0002724002|nr:type II secretion system protein [Herbaspirillum sp. CF444]EJL90071.1 prepilin-type N-terminal cleavage/methylation domain-containing protein [Herbaspirillum sp. CF444]
MTRRTKRAGQEGFTIVELLVTIVIVSILASAAIPMAGLVAKRNKEAELRRSLREIRLALDSYKKAVDDGRVEVRAGDSGYPSNLELLQKGVTDIKSPTSQKIYFLRRIPRDPLQEDAPGSAAATWGKRSYASSAEEPKEGSDVFDVYSNSDGTGLNGIPYREW